MNQLPLTLIELKWQDSKMKKKDIIQLVKDAINEIGADAYGDATLTSQGQSKSRFTKTGRPPGIMEDKKGSFMIGLKVVSRDEMLSYMYSNPNKPIDQGSDGGKWYQTNSVPETDRLVTWDTIKDDMIALEKEYGEGNVVVSGTTRGGDPVVDVYVNSVNENLKEFKTPKTFDPDTLSLVREMLYAADVYHDELVDDADTDKISSYLDKRTGGTIIKFPHYNGPGPGALFGKETTDQIERSKAKAKAAALKTYTQYKTYIEDYEISDVSPAGVYGNIYLWVMFNPLAKDYTAPKGGTQSSQFEGVVSDNESPSLKAKIYAEDMMKHYRKMFRVVSGNFGKEAADEFKNIVKSKMAQLQEESVEEALAIQPERLEKIFNAVNNSRTPDFWKNRFRSMYGIEFPSSLKDIDQKQAVSMNKFMNDLRNNIKEEEGSVTTDDAAEAEKLAKKGIDVKLTDMNEDLDLGHQDDEPHSLKKDLYRIAKYASELYKMVDKYDGMEGEVDFPHWWQAKIIKSRDYLVKAKHYLDGEEKIDQLDAMMEEYIKERENTSITEHMESYKNKAVLMEGAMKKFFEDFDKGMTNEEIIQAYATKGIQVPEQFCSTARKQYEGYKKLKLELEMSEKEFKNSATKIVNNPSEATTGMEMDEKALASGLTQEKLDPVGQEDDDIDNDGDVDKTDKYLAKRRKAVSKAIDKQKK